MSMDHIYNNHGSMERCYGNCKRCIRQSIAREYSTKNASKSIIFEHCSAISILKFFTQRWSPDHIDSLMQPLGRGDEFYSFLIQSIQAVDACSWRPL